jgi:hypothetical protein
MISAEIFPPIRLPDRGCLKLVFVMFGEIIPLQFYLSLYLFICQYCQQTKIKTVVGALLRNRVFCDKALAWGPLFESP